MIDPWTIGLVIAVLGMGGTLLALALIAVLVVLLKRVYPYQPEDAH